MTNKELLEAIVYELRTANLIAVMGLNLGSTVMRQKIIDELYERLGLNG